MEERKVLPNDKVHLLAANNYEMYNLDLLRKVFPRIFAEHDSCFDRKQRKPQIRDIVTLYFYLLSYVDGNYMRKDGTVNKRFGASFPSIAKMSQELGIAEKRIRHLADILEANGMIRQQQVWNGKWYFVYFCPRISDSGYIVNSDGEEKRPELSVYVRDSH